jgi:hypothetical protein
MDIPILYIMFNRPNIVRESLNELKKVKPKYLYISCDGPRKDNNLDERKIKECISLCNTEINWDCDISYKINKKNNGCKIGVTSAVDWFFDNVDEGIILEDDCIVDPTFFEFSSELLKLYRSDESIFMISADGRATKHLNANNAYTYTVLPMLWGWAGWSKKWKQYDVHYKNWNNEKEVVLSNMSKHGISKNFFRKVIDDTVKEKIDTWDYQLCGQFFYNNWKCIVPSVNLVKNIGFGYDASHTKDFSNINAKLKKQKLKAPFNKKFDKKSIKDTMRWYAKNEFSNSLKDRIFRRIMRVINYIRFG